jgi:TolB-like protein
MLPYLQRLRKRKIVQWAVAYAAVAWLSLEVFDLVAEQFFWPVWIRQGATILLLFGLFITIVLAWYHGERGRQKPSWFELVLLTALLALAGQSVWSLRDQYRSVDPDSAYAVSSFRSELLPENSVAVLPCLNLSANEGQSYFADALAAELITRLSAVSGLRIPSHTSSFSFKGKGLSVGEIADSLRVRHVLECDVSGDETRVRVATRLVDTESGYTIWSESYNRTRAKLFDVQQDVAQAVVEKLEISLGTKERQLVNRRWTQSTEAYDEFLRAVRFQAGYPTVESIRATNVHLERAIELDPLFGRAYARLAVNWVYFGNYRLGPSEEAYTNVRRYAAKAMELDGELWEAYWALGWAELAGKFAWLEAERNFRKVIELAPGEWGGYHSLGYVLGVLGRTEEGLQAARMAIDVDPLGFLPLHGLEILLTRQRQYEESISVTLQQAEVVGWNPDLKLQLAWLQASLGLEEDARMQLSEIEPSDFQDDPLQLNVAGILAMLGDREEALEIAITWDQQHLRSEDRFYVGSLAYIYAALGDRESAIQKLLETWERREMWLLFLDYEAFDDLRDDPRFVKLIRKLNLPENVYLQVPVRAPRETNFSMENP